MLTKHKEINAIFIVAAGVYGACRAVLSLKKTEWFNDNCFWYSANYSGNDEEKCN